jgi:hypothetical protein
MAAGRPPTDLTMSQTEMSNIGEINQEGTAGAASWSASKKSRRCMPDQWNQFNLRIRHEGVPSQ